MDANGSNEDGKVTGRRKRPEGATEWTLADWFGEDLTGQTYEGDMDCSESGLTSLRGAPREVKGSFYCEGNQLVSLEGAPEKVDGDFYCGDNLMDSLEGRSRKDRRKLRMRRWPDSLCG